MPITIEISSSFKCTGLALLKSALNCTKNDSANSIDIIFNVSSAKQNATISLTSNKTISFRIYGLKNPPSTKPETIFFASQTSKG